MKATMIVWSTHSHIFNSMSDHPSVVIRHQSLLNSSAYAGLTSWIASRGLAKSTIVAVKLLHTVVFLTLLYCVLDVMWSGIMGRITHRTKVSLAAVTVEAIIFVANGRECPLTVMVEDLGAEHGQVTDIFLPDVVARNIFGISCSLLGIGAAAFAWRRFLGVLVTRR